MEAVEIALEDAVDEFEQQVALLQESDDYLNSNPRDLAIGLSTPPAMRKLLAQVGIPRLYVNAIAERLVIEGFRVGDNTETDEELWSWFKANSLEIAAQVGAFEALGLGRSYITISAPSEADKTNPLAVPDVPIIRVESPKALYAKVSERTGSVEWAIRVVKDEDGDTVGATLYTAESTEIYVADDEGELTLEETITHGLGVVPVVPMIHRESLADNFGTSIINAEIRSVTDAISRLIMNMQATSELMATPQRIIFGSSVDEIGGDAMSALELYTSSYIAVEDPQGKAVQLPAAELRNYTEALTSQLRLAAAYTGLPPQYLSSSDDNPASAEAIKSSESRLIRTCESVAIMLGDAWEKAMRIALLVMGRPLTLDHFRMETVWRDPSTPTYASKADAASKLYANGQGPVPIQQVWMDMGYSPEERRQMEEWMNSTPSGILAGMYAGPPNQGVIDEAGRTGESGTRTDEGDGPEGPGVA